MGRALQQTDLFGAPLERTERRRRNNRTKQVARAIEQMRADHILPLDVLGVMLKEAIARGEREWIFKIAAEMLPYTAPRLAAVVMAGGGLPGGGNRLQVEWGGDGVLDHQTPLHTAQLSAADPPGA